MADLELTVKQAALELGIAERTCRKWLGQGKIEGRKGRKGSRAVWRVSADAVRKLRPEQSAVQDAVYAEQTSLIGPDSRAASAVLGELRSLREENAEYRRVIELQTQAIHAFEERLTSVEAANQEVVGLVHRLLPPAIDEERKARPWWRFWERQKGGE